MYNLKMAIIKCRNVVVEAYAENTLYLPINIVVLDQYTHCTIVIPVCPLCFNKHQNLVVFTVMVYTVFT